MPSRATTDALLRIRQADVEDAVRALDAARDAASRAEVAHARAVAADEASRTRLQRHTGTAPRTAGRLGQRELYRAELRRAVEKSRARLAATARALRETAHALATSQARVEQALRAREAAEAQRAADDKAAARRRERRQEAAADDRWRPPRRG